MPDKAWKAFERRIAKSLGTVRTPLSGGASRLTRSDTLHPCLYVECKTQASIATHTQFQAIRQRARKEQMIPVMALHKKGSKLTLAVIEWNWFVELYQFWHLYGPDSDEIGPTQEPVWPAGE